ncbi:tripartite tricarboxylate transporter permease [Phyllobacterium lublinensis]|uniref:tripartite tricarboxylate transporter permease n=1 Tax=Phyllobacterium lublinensis TaxID=2875708 RepID=UPI001CCA0E8C|nr:tripartite tricarboxylate transporter permease [Phyllobacterium sp. 2063]
MAPDVSMLGAAWDALVILSDPMRLAVLALAALLGVILGILPGIGGLAGTALLLPFTFTMDPYTAFAFLLGLGATTSTGDPIPAVLFGVPGGAGSAATVLDGLPMARRGEAGRALSASYMSSLMGGLFGAVLMGAAVPVLRPIMLNVGTPEMAALAILGLSMVAALSGNAPLRGLAAACIGIIIAMIGTDPRTGTFRWTFDTLYLWDGMPLVPITLGLFALPELCDLAIGRNSISEGARYSIKSGMWLGAQDCFRHWWLILRCSWIGAALGAVPGIGGAVVDWMAYGHAARTEKDADKTFGKGDVRGVIASESANNAKEGGSLLTTVAFGIPGSAGMAIILGAFIAQGLIPGPDMLGKNLAITYSMVWSIAIANIIGAGLCYLFSGQFAKLATLRYTLILPVVLSIIYIGAFGGSRQWGDLFALLAFGILGWVMKRMRWPRPPLILGVVLGASIERYMFISIKLDGAGWLFHPVVLVFFAIAGYGLLGPFIKKSREKRRAIAAGEIAAKSAKPANGNRFSFHLADLFPAALFVAIATLLYQTLGWSGQSALVPRIVCIVALFAIGASLLQGAWGRTEGLSFAKQAEAEAMEGLHMDTQSDTDHVDQRDILLRAGMFFGWLIAFMASMAIIGLIPTIPLFVIAFMRVEAREPWKIVLPQAILLTIFVYVVFDKLLNLPWPQTLMHHLFPAFASLIPSM